MNILFFRNLCFMQSKTYVEKQYNYDKLFLVYQQIQILNN